MKLKKLIKDIDCQIKGSKDIDISGVCANSKVVSPGNLFIAKRGLRTDGQKFIDEAINAGAVAVATDMYDPSISNISQIIHPRPNEIEAVLASRCYYQPSEKLFTVGITGTNGKTTTAMLIKWLFEKFDLRSGLISTIEYIIGPLKYEATHTTPDVCTTHKLLHEMVRQGCRAAIMEVTSHALDQGRVEEVQFDIGLFTNLSPEHLDYHESIEQYASCKAKLFSDLSTKSKKSLLGNYHPLAIVNMDSPWYQMMLSDCKAEVLTYGINSSAEITATDIELTTSGSRFNINYRDKKRLIHSPLHGGFNIYNCLGAIATATRLGFDLEEVADKLADVPFIPGRLQFIPNEMGLLIYVDFAHTEDALRNSLEALRQLSTGRLITLFGCGGDRDRQKRPKMAHISEAHSDFTVITSDNPRSEDPEEICVEISKGFQSQEKYLIEPDRRAAISMAIDLTRPGDILLIAGKGHETTQKFHHQTLPFDDAQIAADLCSAKQRGALC